MRHIKILFYGFAFIAAFCAAVAAVIGFMLGAAWVGVNYPLVGFIPFSLIIVYRVGLEVEADFLTNDDEDGTV